MIYKNHERIDEYNIPYDWYINRDNGLSAMLRCGNDEKWIGACIESILPFFDEIIITLYSNDKTKNIIETFDSPKIKLYEYPFFTGEVDGVSRQDSVHDKAYYYNWSMSKTTKKTVCKWDSDMIMFPQNKKIYDKIISHNVVRIFGYNVVNLKPTILSAYKPIDQYEPRFFKVKKNMFFIQSYEQKGKMYGGLDYPASNNEVFVYDKIGLKNLLKIKTWKKYKTFGLYRLYNLFTRNDIYLHKPFFIHTRYLKKNLETINKSIWFDKALEQGEEIQIELPDYIFKKMGDYLN